MQHEDEQQPQDGGGRFDNALNQVGAATEQASQTTQASDELEKENQIEESAGEIPKGERTLSAIGYILYFCILPLVLKPKSEFCQFHGKQGLVITISMVVLSALAYVFGYLMNWVLAGGWVFPFVVSLAHFGLIVWGVMMSVRGKTTKMPLFGKMAESLKW